MDSEAERSGRVAYSFPAGTFDLQHTQGNLCLASEDGSTTYVGLRLQWVRLFEMVRHLHVVLGAAASGPISLADTWERPDFTLFPGTGCLYDLESAAEIKWHHLASAIAVVDDHGHQQTASIQFFDRQGRGCLKLMLTNFSDLDAFDRLIKKHAVPFDSGVEPEEPLCSGCKPAAKAADADLVRRLWRDAARSRPDDHLPGLSRFKRREALPLVGADLAWDCQGMVVMRALEIATAQSIPLRCTVNNQGIFLPAPFTPTHWHPCEAGLTFFSPFSQLTLRHNREPWEAWATRHSSWPIQSRLTLEIYDDDGLLCGTLTPASEASDIQVHAWNSVLKSHRQM